MSSRSRRRILQLVASCLVLMWVGCGSSGSRRATEQLLMSDAVDKSVAGIDFRALRGKTVYLDTQYVTRVKGFDHVNSDYIISSLRQQLFAAGCLVQERLEDADFVVEARVGALGTDSHDLIYGIPASKAVSTAASLVPSAPPIPAIPEISVARKSEQQGANKIAAFAYHRETREIIWQSGISQARGTAKDTWILGAGPFQHGSIYDSAKFAGRDVGIRSLVPWAFKEEEGKRIVPIDQEVHFRKLSPIDESKVELATFEELIEREPEQDEPEKDEPVERDAPPTPEVDGSSEND